MSVNVLYTTSATAGGIRSASPPMPAGTPRAFDDLQGEDNNPEQLFATGYSACFLGAMKYVAAQKDIAKIPAGATVTATVGIGLRAAGGFGLDVTLRVFLPGLDDVTADRLMAEAQDICPYTNATRGNIEVRLERA